MSALSPFQVGPSGEASGPPVRPSGRGTWVGDVGVALACLAAGVALGALWLLVGAVVVDATDAQERAVASDGTLALLGTGFGLVSALLLAVLPGRRQVLRAGIALGGATVGAYVARVTGLRLGAPTLRADGVVLAWPVTLGAVTTVRLLVLYFIGRDEG